MKNARMDEFEEREHAIYPALRVLNSAKTVNYKWIEGYVRHELGYLHFTSTISFAGSKTMYLRISVIHKGKQFQRTWNAWYGQKTIARLANEFIEEIKGENP